ncbi:hypothetical protein ACWOFR_13940 [Carnobacterium gallinarum]|uniref:hypothetical protein n=1 Tax=Carnobacterium gallinarum TaxID=2749 RepID=UPI00054D965F|nr:hypothetical protein [Carnobacterium gallinarum]
MSKNKKMFLFCFIGFIGVICLTYVVRNQQNNIIEAFSKNTGKWQVSTSGTEWGELVIQKNQQASLVWSDGTQISGKYKVNNFQKTFIIEDQKTKEKAVFEGVFVNQKNIGKFSLQANYQGDNTLLVFLD